MNPLVSPSWLRERIGEPDLAVLDASLSPPGAAPAIDTAARYLANHIPGAVFFDIEALSDRSTSLPHMLPAAEDFARAMSELGVGDGMTLVVYEQQEMFSAARAWWMLRVFGARRVYLLDGGLPAWAAEGHPLEAGNVNRAPASFRAEFDAAAVTDFAGVLRAMAEGRQILDARSAARFRGDAAEPRPGLRSGHMPGAIHLHFADLVREGRLKPAEELAGIFLARGVDLDKPVVTTCGSGVTAAVLSLGLEILGAAQVSLYDGSWAEYARRPEAKIETGS